MSIETISAPPAPDRALYETIAAELLDGIARGQFPVGSLLPTEAELSATYDVSRQTVRAAMRHLLELGAISRRKGIGTRVEERSAPVKGFTQTLATLDDLVSLAEGTRRDIRSLEMIVFDRRQAKTLGAKPGTRWLKITYLRLPRGGDAAPIGWSEVYIDERYAGIEVKVAKYEGLISDLIEREYGALVAEVRQAVTAISLPGPVATLVNVQAGSAALRVARHYFNRKGELMVIVVAIHPGDRYPMTSVLKRVRG
ncbi:MAG: GntR family transcriptional regulator [Hyphomicrobiaceae bacterium]